MEAILLSELRLPVFLKAPLGYIGVRRNPDKIVTFLGTRISVHPESCRTESLAGLVRAPAETLVASLSESPGTIGCGGRTRLQVDNVPRRNPAPEWASRSPESLSRASWSPAGHEKTGPGALGANPDD
jgi:hypothetical protein